jgi:hypothetical protein
MSGFADPWVPGFDPATGMLVLPSWPAAVVAALFVGYCTFVFGRAGRDGLAAGLEGLVEALPRAGLLLAGAAVMWIVASLTSAGNFAAQRRLLDGRLLEMRSRALVPGSALACLDATAGALVEASCEKAVFGTPEAAAASVAYVAAQLSLLADGNEYERRSGADFESALGGLRHALATDRFGFVAHVLEDRDRCTADRCDSFALLRDTSRVAGNLIEHKYDSYVTHHSSEWLQSALSLVAANSPPASPPLSAPPPPASPTASVQNSASAASGKAASNGLFFPSSASIPPVSIMSAEPTGPPPQASAADAAAKPPAAAARKPAPATQQQAHRPANLAPPGRPAPAPDQAGAQ